MKPVIGIITKFFNQDTYYGWSWQRISNNLRYTLNKNGALVMGILPQPKTLMFQERDEHDERLITDEEKQDILHFIKMCDGIILQGGMNSCYYEEFVAKYCYENDIPTLGICAGYNTMIRALSGTTKRLDNKDHEKPFDTYAHGVKVIDKKSIYYSIVKEESFQVNSIHLYIADKLPDCLKTVAISDDNQVEVIEAPDKKFYMGIKYHPELLCDLDKKQNDIFVAFINACKKQA